jgi:hypothetical protein
MDSIVLSFDIGIHNLAFCTLQKNGENTYQLLAWDNVSLLTDTSNVDNQPAKHTCAYCKAKPKYNANGTHVCGKHTPTLMPPLKDVHDVSYKKLPSIGVLREILSTKHNEKVPNKKDTVHAAIAKHYSVPLEIVKKQNASTTSMETIHDGIRTLVEKHKELWSKCTLICLENQPAFKNPHMKSVQMMLFATLRDFLQPNPPSIKLVHAGKKVQGITKGDSGYAARKKGSEDRAEEFLKTLGNTKWSMFYASAKKKNDLADALCMCIDHA